MNYFTYELKENGYQLDCGETCLKDIPYKSISNKNTLDLYYPKDCKELNPVVVFLHGGAFVGGDKGRHLAGVLQSLKRGYVVASVNYRLNNEARYDELYQDVVDALEFLAENEKEYKVDMKRVVLWGDTHGGYLASSIAIQYPKIYDKFHINGVVSFYAPIDLYDNYKKQMETGNYLSVNGEIVDEKTFGLKHEELLDKLKTMDPLPKIDGTECPFYLLHGKKDFNIPREYSIRFSQALGEKEVTHVLQFVEDGIHGIDFYAVPKYNEPILQFIDVVLGDK